MRKGWELKKLSELCEFFNDGNWIESKDQSDNGYRLIQTGNVGIGEFRNKSGKERYISEDTFKRLKCTEIFEGDILISRLPDPVGRTCIVPSVGQKMITAVDCSIVRLKKNIITPEYLKYYSQSQAYFKNISENISGTTRDRISRKNLGNIPVPTPSLPEQQRIVAILDEAFEAIDQAKANTEKNLQNAKELFQSELNSIFTNKGEGWVERSILNVCKEIFAGGDAPKENFSALKTETYHVPIYANAVKDRGLYGFTNEARVLEPSITISARGSGTGHTELRYDSFLPIVRLIVLIPDSSLISLEFLKYSVDNLDIFRSGSAIPQLTVPMIKEYKMPLPPLPVQQNIVYQLNTLSFETKQLEENYRKKLENLEELKKSILQKAFSGELTRQTTEIEMEQLDLVAEDQAKYQS